MLEILNGGSEEEVYCKLVDVARGKLVEEEEEEDRDHSEEHHQGGRDDIDVICMQGEPDTVGGEWVWDIQTLACRVLHDCGDLAHGDCTLENVHIGCTLEEGVHNDYI